MNGHPVFQSIGVPDDWKSRKEIDLTEELVPGANTLAIAVLQLPVLKALRGRRRLPALALMNLICASGWLAVFLGGVALRQWAAAACIAAGAALFGLGECFLPLQTALVADLAPGPLRGRYLALVSTATQLGLVIGPALGGIVLDHAPRALWPAAAAVLLMTGVGALRLERLIPPELQRTPRTERRLASQAAGPRGPAAQTPGAAN